jgi:hypothetical protein
LWGADTIRRERKCFGSQLFHRQTTLHWIFKITWLAIDSISFFGSRKKSGFIMAASERLQLLSCAGESAGYNLCRFPKLILRKWSIAIARMFPKTTISFGKSQLLSTAQGDESLQPHHA